MFTFLLGREFKLSIAEINAVFTKAKIVYFDKNILVVDGLKEDEVINAGNKLGGTIKIIKIKLAGDNKIEDYIVEKLGKNNDGKMKYAINDYPHTQDLKYLLMDTKKALKNAGINSRFINKNFTLTTAAQIIGEKIVATKSDFYVFNIKKTIYFGYTIWIQNIDQYAARDFAKDRSMNIGMLPPKLAQMMINLSEGKTIYDPFVGLATTLIESVYMGNTQVYGSDLNGKTVDRASNNLDKLKGDGFNFEYKTEKLDAKKLEDSTIFSDNCDAIVTEGYLGEMMTQKNISNERIKKQFSHLEDLYFNFFAGLQNIKFKGNIVISFPFWEIKGKYLFCDPIYDILDKYTDVQKILPKDIALNETKVGSLLYKRKNQLVGREIFKLKIKQN